MTTSVGQWFAPFRWRELTLLFAALFIRLFAYGALSVVLVFYLTAVGLTEYQTGLLLSLTLLGDTAVSLVSRLLPTGSGAAACFSPAPCLMVGAGLVFSFATHFWLLLLRRPLA